jgi:hypothetical protein
MSDWDLAVDAIAKEIEYETPIIVKQLAAAFRIRSHTWTGVRALNEAVSFEVGIGISGTFSSRDSENHRSGSGWPSIAEGDVTTSAGVRQENIFKVKLNTFRVCIVEAEAGDKDTERTETSYSAIRRDKIHETSSCIMVLSNL